MLTNRKAQEDSIFSLEALPDGVIALVVDHLPRGADDKKALRSVSRRLRGLVDSKILRLWIKYRNPTLNDLDTVAARWPALRVLRLWGLLSAAGPAVGRATFASLEELGIEGKKIAPDAVKELAAAMARMPRLRKLDLRSASLGDAGVQALAQVECPSLEDICLGGNGLGPDAVTAIANASAHWPKLRVLNLSDHPQLGAAGAEALRRAAFPCMEELWLAGCGLGPAGAHSLACAAAHWPRLKKLSVKWNALRSEGVAALLAAPLPALEVLWLDHNIIIEQGAAAIAAASPRLPKMRHLELFGNSLCSNGARALAQAHFPQLERLNLVGNSIGAAGKADLDAARLGWPKLSELLV